jgi:hypothetical protein
MFTTRIAITGHRPNGFVNNSYVKDLCSDVVEFCRNTYHGSEFNLGGAQGADMWVAEACMCRGDTPFHLYLPFPVQEMTVGWKHSDRTSLTNSVLAAKSVRTAGEHFSNHLYHVRNRAMVDDAHFVICFWEGLRSGGTFSTIKYATSRGVQVLNALNDMEEVKL